MLPTFLSRLAGWHARRGGKMQKGTKEKNYSRAKKESALSHYHAVFPPPTPFNRIPRKGRGETPLPTDGKPKLSSSHAQLMIHKRKRKRKAG